MSGSNQDPRRARYAVQVILSVEIITQPFQADYYYFWYLSFSFAITKQELSYMGGSMSLRRVGLGTGKIIQRRHQKH